jgi:4a-hydroxytetrahydrobiopterin dehydratase
METRLTRAEISAAVTGLGWRLILGALHTSVTVSSLASAAALAGRVISAAGQEAGLRADLRAGQLLLTLQSPGYWVTSREIEQARRISAVVAELGLDTSPGPPPVQALEIAIDALDIPAVRPFWRAVLGYADEPGQTGPLNGIVDPLGQGPALWFQQMDAPRPQRNRIHLDVSVPHDEAAARIQATLDAGGTLLSAAEAPAFWVLADPEGNEACITTWQGRD